LRSLGEAVAILREETGASTAYVLWGDDWFRKLGEPGDPTDYEIKQEGFWLVNRFMADGGEACAFSVEDRKVHGMTKVRPGIRRSHMAAPIPMPEGNAEMLIAGGLRERLRKSQIVLLELAAPVLAHLVTQIVDSQRAQRQRTQLQALTDIARVVVHTQERGHVLEDLATSMSDASGFEIVALSALDELGTGLSHRVLNRNRYSEHQVSHSYRNGALDGVIVALARRKKPALYGDLAKDPRLSDEVRYLLSGKGLIASMASYPLVFQDEVLGLMSLSSLSPHRLDEEETRLLEGLAAQTAMILKGLDMYEELSQSRERLKESLGIENRLARTDALTGIPNRRYLDEAIEGECEGSLKGANPLTLVMADIDDFKEINDRYGHRFGDDLLRLVASIGWQNCSEGEIVGRYGGDEFLFILRDKGEHEARRFGERFRQATEKATLYAPPGEAIGVTVSVGVYECSRESLKRPAELVERADQTMYRSKAQGGNRVLAFSGTAVRGPDR
jgi:diguanylate cyclase (GGDEF)-like protein